MQLTCAMLARCAELSESGAVHILGGDINSLRLEGAFPAVSGVPLYYVVKLAVEAVTLTVNGVEILGDLRSLYNSMGRTPYTIGFRFGQICDKVYQAYKAVEPSDD